MFRQSLSDWGYVQADFYRLGVCLGTLLRAGHKGRWAEGKGGVRAEMMGRREGRQKRWADGKGAAKMAEKTGRREGGGEDGQKRRAGGKGAGMTGRKDGQKGRGQG
jgi:hypothetical protein